MYEDEEMITVVGSREPFKFVCSIGPGCPNHDWSLVSPLHLIRKKNNRLCKKPNEMRHAKTMTYELMLTKPKVCAKHGWTQIEKCPVRIACKRGPGCVNHDWWFRSPLKVICKDGPLCKKHDWAKYGITGKCDGKYAFDMDLLEPPERVDHIHWMGCNERYPGCFKHPKKLKSPEPKRKKIKV